MAMKIYCNAECEYNKGHCQHPENLDMGCYGGIDRCYVEKCILFAPKNVCKWYAEFEGVCCNGDCPERADICPYEEEQQGCYYFESEGETE